MQPLEIPHPRQVEWSHIHWLHHDEHGPLPAALRGTNVAAMTMRQHARIALAWRARVHKFAAHARWLPPIKLLELEKAYAEE